MAQRRHLQHAPITEALVDLRSAPTVDFTQAGVLDRLKKALSDRYSKHSQRGAFEALVEVRHGQPQVPKATDRGLHGHFFESSDGCDIAQFRVDGFTYNRLAPYTDGGAVIKEALRLWNLHVEVARPNVVIDIDAFQIGEFDVSPEVLRPVLHALRELKNAAFFGSITEEAAQSSA